MPKLHQIDDILLFNCPGCGNAHHVAARPNTLRNGASWEWNGSMDAPTFSPSVLTNGDMPEHRCHCYVRDGKIQFLSDCHHQLAGQTVDLPEWDGE